MRRDRAGRSGTDARHPETQLHGTLVEVLGVGILLVGPSGIGKSECALELVARGYRLVADDVGRIRREGEGLVGRAPSNIRHFTEIRGLGLLFVPDLYGPDSVAEEGAVDLVCRLQHWQQGAEYDRVGDERQSTEIAGISVTALELPVRPATSMATLLEVVARDHRARRRGAEPVRDLTARLRAGRSAE